MAKKITFYSVLTLFAMLLSYLEGVAFAFVPIPGFKLGLANTVSMLLISNKHIKGGIAVNLARILLSALLFGNINSLFLSLCGGFLSTVTVIILAECKCFTFAGISSAAGAVHNFGQICGAVILFGTSGLFYLLPILLLCGTLMGFLLGISLNLFTKKYQNILIKILN